MPRFRRRAPLLRLMLFFAPYIDVTPILPASIFILPFSLLPDYCHDAATPPTPRIFDAAALIFRRYAIFISPIATPAIGFSPCC
jgi:hypothetical protein